MWFGLEYVKLRHEKITSAYVYGITIISVDISKFEVDATPLKRENLVTETHRHEIIFKSYDKDGESKLNVDHHWQLDQRCEMLFSIYIDSDKSIDQI